MFQRVKLEEFKALRKVEVELEPFTVLVGPNASGKSSFLEALHLLAQSIRVPSDKLLTDTLAPDILASHGGIHSFCVYGEGRWSGLLDAIALQVTCKEPGITGPVEQQWINRFGDVPWVANLSLEWEGQEVTGGLIPSAMVAAIGPVSMPAFEPKHLAKPDYADPGEVPQLASTGKGLAPVLAHLHLSQPKQFKAIAERLREVVPTVEDIRIDFATVTRQEYDGEKLRKRDYRGFEVRFDMKGAHDLPAHAVSEGTLLTLGLITQAMGPAQPHLLLIDDLERGLHPKAMAELIGQLRRLQKEMPELQIVATSHSPYLLDHLEPAEVRLTALRDDGSVAIAPLSAHPDFDRWKDLMSAGELWSTVGERWVTEQEKPEARATS